MPLTLNAQLSTLNSTITAVVLVGGLGTRIQSLYPNIPKPMIPVLGKPFVEWVLRYLRAQGIQRAILSSGYRAEVVEEHFAAQPVEGMEVNCIAEPEPLGTAGGFLNAVTALPRPVRRGEGRGEGVLWLVLNGDSLVFADLGPAIELLKNPEVEAVVVGIEVPDTARYGKLRFNCSGQLLHFGEKEPGKGVINAGIYLFKDSVLAKFPSSAATATARPGRLALPSPEPVMQLSFEKDVFPALLNRQTNIQVCVISGPFLDIGTPASVAQADAFIKENLNAFSKS